MAWTVWIALGAILAATGVGLGAFGAHALKDQLSPTDLIIFETAVRYQMYHALALIGVGIIALRLESILVQLAGTSIFLGTVLFSGSLYYIVFSAQKQFAIMAPLGGGLLVIGWLVLAVAVSILALGS